MRRCQYLVFCQALRRALPRLFPSSRSTSASAAQQFGVDKWDCKPCCCPQPAHAHKPAATNVHVLGCAAFQCPWCKLQAFPRAGEAPFRGTSGIGASGHANQERPDQAGPHLRSESPPACLRRSQHPIRRRMPQGRPPRRLQTQRSRQTAPCRIHRHATPALAEAHGSVNHMEGRLQRCAERLMRCARLQ